MMMVTVMMMIIVIMVIIMILIIWMRKMGKLRTTCCVPAGITTKEGGEGAKTPSYDHDVFVFVFVFVFFRTPSS